jgi:hypothetical protein
MLGTPTGELRWRAEELVVDFLAAARNYHAMRVLEPVEVASEGVCHSEDGAAKKTQKLQKRFPHQERFHNHPAGW